MMDMSISTCSCMWQLQVSLHLVNTFPMSSIAVPNIIVYLASLLLGDYDLLLQIITNKQWWTDCEQHVDTDTVVTRYMDKVPDKVITL